MRPLSEVEPAKATFIMTGFIPLPLGAVSMLNSNGGVGKALDVNERVLTPDGWKRMGQISHGDYVIGSDGKKTRVTGVFYQGIREAYRVEFVDGTSVVCDGEHLWTVTSATTPGGTFTTNEMIEKGIYRDKYDKRYGTVQREFYYGVPICADGYEFGGDNFVLEPYIVGVLLGDGYLRNNCVVFCNKHEWLVKKVASLLPDGDELKYHFDRGAFQCTIKTKGNKSTTTARELKKYGLMDKRSYQKFIPDAYKNATLKSRKELIRGLIDTDGHVGKGHLLEYSTSSKQLAKDFLEVGRSIGMFLTIRERIPHYTYRGERKTGRKNYRIYQKNQTNKKIVSITPVGKREMMCIKVEAPDGLFVVNGFTLTHNTRLALLMADKLSRLEGKKSLLWLTEDYPGMVRHIYDQFIEEGMVDPKSLNDIYVLERDAVQLAYIENRIFKPNYQELEAISNEIIDVEASLLVLDPLLSFYGGNENDNSQADIFMLGLVEMAQNLNISILLIHHNRKAIDGSDSGIFRGASAFHNKCRMRYSLDVIKNPAGGIDEYEHDAGYRQIRLMKDSWGGFKYWRKFTGGTREAKIKIAPAWKE